MSDCGNVQKTFVKPDQEEREEKWRAISYIIESGKVSQTDVAMFFQNNPFFFYWYKRTILSDTPISETYH